MERKQQLPLPGWACYRVSFLCPAGTPSGKFNRIPTAGAGCIYWIEDFGIGNCVLRATQATEPEDLSIRMRCSRQNINRTEDWAIKKLRRLAAEDPDVHDTLIRMMQIEAYRYRVE